MPTARKRQSGAGAEQEAGDAYRQRHRRIDQRVLPEQDGPDHRQVRQERDVDTFELEARLPDEGLADHAREAESEQRESEPGRDLVGGKPQHQEAEQAGKRHPARHGGDDAQIGGAGQLRAREAGHGADDHHALDAEIEDARALRHELAERRDQQRRRGRDDGKDDRLEAGHGASSARAAGRRIGWKWRR